MLGFVFGSGNVKLKKAGWCCGSVVKCLPRMYKVLGFIPSIRKRIEESMAPTLQSFEILYKEDAMIWVSVS
jgi:hypothetical protein